jgi:hypothetical protein
MTTKWKWRLAWSVGVLLVLLVAAWFLWLPVVTTRVVRHGEQFFHDNFQPDDDLHAAIHEDTWALWYFAGTKGLPEIRRLSQDATLIPSGRQIASNLYTHVSTGGHIPSIRWNLEQGDLPWLGRRYYSYLLKQDVAHLRSKGLPVPEGTNP